MMRDIFVTRDEIRGLMDGLLCVDTPPTGTTRLTDWMRAHARRSASVTPANWPAAATTSPPISDSDLPAPPAPPQQSVHLRAGADAHAQEVPDVG